MDFTCSSPISHAATIAISLSLFFAEKRLSAVNSFALFSVTAVNCVSISSLDKGFGGIEI